MGNLLQKINNETNGEFSEWLTQHGRCPECSEKLTKKDGEIVCTECGLVVSEIEAFSHIVPMGTVNVPGNDLGFGNAMGQSLQRKGMFSVICVQSKTVYKDVCPKCGYEIVKDDAPVRAQQCSTITEKYEHPKMQSLLKFGRQRSFEWGFSKREHAVFSNYLGKMLRRVGAAVVTENARADLSGLADGCFALSLRDLFGGQKFMEAIEKYKIEMSTLVNIERINHRKKGKK